MLTIETVMQLLLKDFPKLSELLAFLLWGKFCNRILFDKPLATSILYILNSRNNGHQGVLLILECLFVKSNKPVQGRILMLCERTLILKYTHRLRISSGLNAEF